MAASGIGNTAYADGRMDSSKWLQNLEAHVTLLVKKLKLKKSWLLQQDNDSKHTSKSNMNYLNKCKLKLIESLFGSLMSPSLKTLWVDLKDAVHASQPKDISELVMLYKEQWVQNPKKKQLFINICRKMLFRRHLRKKIKKKKELRVPKAFTVLNSVKSKCIIVMCSEYNEIHTWVLSPHRLL